MREFMDWIQTVFYQATYWNRESSYSNLNANSEAILSFEVPRGIRFTLSSLATPHFASSYQLGTVTIVDGSIAYLYSNARLGPLPRSEAVQLQSLLCSYRMLTPLATFERSVPPVSSPPHIIPPPIPPPRPAPPSLPKVATTTTTEQANPTIPLQPTVLVDRPLTRTPAPAPVPAPTSSALREVPRPSPGENSFTPVPEDKTPTQDDKSEGVSSVPTGTRDAAATQTGLESTLPNAIEVATAFWNDAVNVVSTQYKKIEWSTDSLMYGRMYLPHSQLEALGLRRITPRLQCQLRAVSQDSIKNGGTILGLLQYDAGRYGIEGLASTDGGVLGLRGMYNFGGDASDSKSPPVSTIPANGGDNVGTTSPSGNANGNANLNDRIYGRASVGAEIYYGTLNKSGGMSLGARFSTLPANMGIPLTATATVNPLMGNFSTTYTVMAGPNFSIASRFDWNIYSYESDWVIGVELWRQREIQASASRWNTSTKPQHYQDENDSFYDISLVEAASEKQPDTRSKEAMEWRNAERSRRAKLEWKTDEDLAREETEEELKRLRDMDPHIGVFKARLDQHLRVGLVWEGRVKSLLFGVGTSVDLRRPDQPFRTLGLEVQYSR